VGLKNYALRIFVLLPAKFSFHIVSFTYILYAGTQLCIGQP